MVYILLAPGFEEAEALVPADLLRRGGVETALVSTDGAVVAGGRQDYNKSGSDFGPGGAGPVRHAGFARRWCGSTEAGPGTYCGEAGPGRRRSGESLWPPSVRPLRCWAGGGCWRADGPSAIPAWRDR